MNATLYNISSPLPQTRRPLNFANKPFRVLQRRPLGSRRPVLPTEQPAAGVGVIWDGMPFETPVIPAKAGIQSVDSAFPKVCGVDSRFRGNDCDLQRPCLPNDTSTPAAFLVAFE
jgi:hypothetical protein